ncbi:transmembrane protein 17B-like [Bradysia coprophila]|uniref:transmembrane protein 17B-like n=1 Tax=Bradysia coprophila TaxID=38358 RepID=UPI00187D75F7|nr:transmembrane protein 17B-like [Bradysia coprophila]
MQSIRMETLIVRPAKMEIQKVRTNIWLQISLYLNAYFAPIWIVSSIYYYHISKQFIVSPIEEILTITAITIGIPTEISRLYFGYSGNLREQIPDLAAFLISTSFVRLPIQCYLLLAEHTAYRTGSLIVQSIAMTLLLLQMIIGFYVIRVYSKTRAKQFRMEMLIRQQNATMTSTGS